MLLQSGFFDGFHLGHQHLINLVKLKMRMNVSIVFTFDPHPANVHTVGDNSVELLYSVEKRVEFL